MNRVIVIIFGLLNKIYPKSANINLFISSPDFTDNSFALFKYILKNSNNDKKKYIWLVDNIKNKSLYKKLINRNINNSMQNKIYIFDKKSLYGLYYFIKAKYIFFTHGFYTGMTLPKNQIRVNLWHGMPLKAIGYLNKQDINKVPKSSFAIATSKFYQDVISRVFNLENKKVIITGQPRCDFLFSTEDTLKVFNIQKENYKKIVLWAPTYRYDKDNKIKDGIFKNTLPVIKDLESLNIYLNKIDSFLIIKLHPMDILNNFEFKELSNIKVIKDRDIIKKSLQFYELLANIDILITDFSSIYIDFLLLDRPIIFLIDDFKEYEHSRSFIFSNPKDYMPGYIATNIYELKVELKRLIINNEDSHKEKRDLLTKKFHKYKKDFSKRLLNMLEQKCKK